MNRLHPTRHLYYQRERVPRSIIVTAVNHSYEPNHWSLHSSGALSALECSISHEYSPSYIANMKPNSGKLRALVYAALCAPHTSSQSPFISFEPSRRTEKKLNDANCCRDSCAM